MINNIYKKSHTHKQNKTEMENGQKEKPTLNLQTAVRIL